MNVLAQKHDVPPHRPRHFGQTIRGWHENVLYSSFELLRDPATAFLEHGSQVPGERPSLLAYFWHCGGFPKAAFSGWPDREKRAGRDSHVVHQSPVFVDFQPEEKRIGSRKPLH